MFKERDTRMVTQKKGKLKDYAKMKKMKDDAKNSAKKADCPPLVDISGVLFYFKLIIFLSGVERSGVLAD